MFRPSAGAEFYIGLSIYYGNNVIDTFRYKLDKYDKRNEKDCYVLGDKWVAEKYFKFFFLLNKMFY